MAVAAKLTMKLITVSISVPLTIATKKAVEKSWLALHPDDPPRRTKDADVTLGDAVTWAALSAVGLVLSDLASRRGAEAIYRTVLGVEPPASAASSPKKLKQQQQAAAK